MNLYARKAGGYELALVSIFFQRSLASGSLAGWEKPAPRMIRRFFCDMPYFTPEAKVASYSTGRTLPKTTPECDWPKCACGNTEHPKRELTPMPISTGTKYRSCESTAEHLALDVAATIVELTRIIPTHWISIAFRLSHHQSFTPLKSSLGSRLHVCFGKLWSSAIGAEGIFLESFSLT